MLHIIESHMYLKIVDDKGEVAALCQRADCIFSYKGQSYLMHRDGDVYTIYKTEKVASLTSPNPVLKGRPFENICEACKRGIPKKFVLKRF